MNICRLCGNYFVRGTLQYPNFIDVCDNCRERYFGVDCITTDTTNTDKKKESANEND